MSTTTNDGRIRQLFDALRRPESERVVLGDLRNALVESGLRLDDPRLAESLGPAAELGDDAELSAEAFVHLVGPDVVQIERALRGEFVIPDFEDFSGEFLGGRTTMAAA